MTYFVWTSFSLSSNKEFCREVLRQHVTRDVGVGSHRRYRLGLFCCHCFVAGNCSAGLTAALQVMMWNYRKHLDSLTSRILKILSWFDRYCPSSLLSQNRGVVSHLNLFVHIHIVINRIGSITRKRKYPLLCSRIGPLIAQCKVKYLFIIALFSSCFKTQTTVN